MEAKQITCIVCPRGCRLTVTKDNDEYKVSGNFCKRGIPYGISEVTNPVRTITTTVKCLNGIYPCLPVISDQPVPKGLIFEIIKAINKVYVYAPVNYGDIIIENVLNTGINIIASRTMNQYQMV